MHTVLPASAKIFLTHVWVQVRSIHYFFASRKPERCTSPQGTPCHETPSYSTSFQLFAKLSPRPLHLGLTGLLFIHSTFLFSLRIESYLEVSKLLSYSLSGYFYDYCRNGETSRHGKPMTASTEKTESTRYFGVECCACTRLASALRSDYRNRNYGWFSSASGVVITAYMLLSCIGVK